MRPTASKKKHRRNALCWRCRPARRRLLHSTQIIRGRLHNDRVECRRQSHWWCSPVNSPSQRPRSSRRSFHHYRSCWCRSSSASSLSAKCCPSSSQRESAATPPFLERTGRHRHAAQNHRRWGNTPQSTWAQNNAHAVAKQPQDAAPALLSAI